MLKKTKTVGIIGGMGPLATADLFTKVIRMTVASTDQEHLRVLIDNNTSIPDRTRAILYGGEDPLPQLVSSARLLAEAGADFLIMPCNTAHYFYDELCRQSSIPVLNMLEETAELLRERGVRRAGLLATDGTIRSGVYAAALEKRGVKILTPDAAGQQEVMRIIYDGVKAGKELDPGAFIAVCKGLLDQGAETLILGCTELPPAFSIYNVELPHVDPTLVLAAAAVRYAGAECFPLGPVR